MSLTREERRALAKERGLVNVDAIWTTSFEANLPFYIACALMEQESGGKNVYGHDEGGALSGYPGRVDRSNFDVFRWLVEHEGYESNGVGPAQITWYGFFDQMDEEGLRPWDVEDNMFFGFSQFRRYLDAEDGDLLAAAKRYNSKPTYAPALVAKIKDWKQAMHG